MTNVNIYNIDHGILAEMLTASAVRKPKRLAFLRSLLTPIVLAYQNFRIFRTGAVYRLSHNGSIVLLTKVLNDKFNVQNWQSLPETDRIRIKNIQQQEAVRFYPAAAEKEVGFYPLSMGKQVGFRPSLEYDPSAADFTVYVPIALQPGAPELLENFLIRMRGQIDYYKLYAKKYRIIWV